MLFALCALFTLMPFSAAVESPNTENTTAVDATAGQDLKIGMTGDEVKEVQTWLKNQGFYSGNIDGEFGNYTEQAVKLFQQYVGIKADGVVGNLSRQHMDKLTNRNSNLSSDSTSSSTQSSKTGSSSRAAYGNKATYRNNNGYSNSYRTSSGWSSGKGVGDCWDNSNVLYNQLTSSGQKARIVQYANSYVNNHRSVQVYKNGAWVDYNYRGNGYSNRYYAQKNKPGMTVIR